MTGETDHGQAARRHAAHAYLEAPLRRPLAVLLPTALILAGAVAATFVLPKQYRASTLLGTQPATASDRPQPRTDVETESRRLQAIEQAILSRSVLERVVKEADLSPEFSGTGAQVGRLRAAMSVRAAGADSLRVECVHANPAKAAQVVNRVASLFVEEAESERERLATRGPKKVAAQLAEAEKALGEKETALRRLTELAAGRETEPGASTQAALRRLQVERQIVSGKLGSVETEALILRRSIEQESGARPEAADSPSAELVQLRSRLAELRQRYTDRYPEVQALLRRIQELESKAPRAPETDPGVTASQAELAKAEAEIETLKQRRSSIDVEIARLRSLAERSARAEEERAELAREYSRARETYLALLKEWTEAEAALRSEPSWLGEGFRVLEPARVPERPFFPGLADFALGGLIAGLGLGLLVALVIEFLDHSVKGPEDLEEILSSPLLVTIPYVGRPGAADRE